MNINLRAQFTFMLQMLNFWVKVPQSEAFCLSVDTSETTHVLDLWSLMSQYSSHALDFDKHLFKMTHNDVEFSPLEYLRCLPATSESSPLKFTRTHKRISLLRTRQDKSGHFRETGSSIEFTLLDNESFNRIISTYGGLVCSTQPSSGISHPAFLIDGGRYYQSESVPGELHSL